MADGVVLARERLEAGLSDEAGGGRERCTSSIM